MAPKSYEFRDVNVGGVPRYAQRRAAAETDAAAEFAEYGNDPNELPGASSLGSGGELQDLDAERDAGDDLAGGGQAGQEFGGLVEDEPERVDHSADGTSAGDKDLLDDDEVVIPAQSAPAEAAEDQDPADDVTAEDSAQPETADGRFEERTAGPEEVAAIIAGEFGLDIEEARRLVAEAQATLGAEETDAPGEPADAIDDAVPDDLAPNEHEDEADSTDTTTPKERVVAFLRTVASKTGQITSSEAAKFAEGARALGDDFRDWYATKDERSRERALERVRKDVEKRVRQWEKFEQHRGRTGTQAPRGTDDR